jgi:enoyl-CoA hydratase
MSQEIKSSLNAGILTLTIHRPEQGNALNHAVIKGLADAIGQTAENRAVRVLALTGAGDRVFCAGADLKSALGETDQGRGLLRRAYHELLVAILRCPKPTVALARGHVLAGGLGILLACDLALACDDIDFSTPEIHVGMLPMMVMALLCRHAGRKKAVEMMVLGERVTADAAASLGIVNHVYPRQQFEKETAEFLRKIADKSGSILRLGKEALWKLECRVLEEDLEFFESALAGVMSTADSQEGMRAFLEKRPPAWKDE